MRRSALPLIAVLLPAACRSAPPAAPAAEAPAGRISLDGTWTIEGLPAGVDASAPGYFPKDLLPAPVPGIVQTALLAAGRIADPYLGMQNETSQWVLDRTWWYRHAFRAPESLRGRLIRLRFEGVCYESTVWLNGRKVGTTIGMHDRAAFDVSSVLAYDRPNLLVVRIPPPPADRILGEICQMSYGWDFAPKIVPVGIWRSVTLEATGPQWIDSPSVETNAIAEGTADLTLRAQLVNTGAEPRPVTLRGEVAGAGVRFAKEFTLEPHGVQEAVVAFRLPDARLWWPNGMGEPDRYRLDLALEARGGADAGAVLHAASAAFGVRTVRLEKNEGAAARDYPWTFVVNGRRTHILGANWVPVDSLWRAERWRYERLLRRARDTGVKLIRVWGGGVLESDDFYDLCDRYGLMAWQEFPLAVAEDYSKIPRPVFRDDAADQVLRLRGHPSLVLWNGGNEFNPDNDKNKDLVDGLATTVARLDPGRPFFRASPYHGEEHDWTVWHGLQSHTEYRRPVGFRSEAGMQSPPFLENLKRFIPADQLWPVQAVHEYRRLTSHWPRYANEYGPSADAADWVRKLQLAQAAGYAFNIESCRSKKYLNSGILLWQWNEPWPCICWSLVDGFGDPKPACDAFRRAGEPVRIAADYATVKWVPGGAFRADVIVINDRAAALAGVRATADLVDRTGAVLLSREWVLDVPADGVAHPGAVEWTLPPKPDDVPGRFFFLRLRLADARGGELSRNVAWHGIKEVHPPGWLQMDLIDGWKIRVDPDKVGGKEGWFREDLDDASWGAYEAGIPWELQGYADYDGDGWLRRWVEIPESWKGTPVLAGFGGVDDAYVLYVNGGRVVKHGEYPNNVWDTLTVTDITAHVRFGARNLIAMQVEDWRADGGIRKRPSRLANTPDAFTTPEYDNLFAGLAKLPPAEVHARAARAPQGAKTLRWSVQLENVSAAPAFQVRLDASGVPEGWYSAFSDNAFVLWGGEKREIVWEATPLESHPAPGPPPDVRLRLSGWNVAEQAVGP